MEIRTDNNSKIETNSKKLFGHAAVFNTLSNSLGDFREIIKPGAFASSLDGDIRALLNHDASYVLGRTSANTLSVAEDDIGLYVEILPPNTSFGNDLLESVSRGDISQMSFGFRVRPEGEQWEKDEDGMFIRTLTDLELVEVSPVAFPVYPQTDIAARSLDSFINKTQNNSINTIIRLRTRLHWAEYWLNNNNK